MSRTYAEELRDMAFLRKPPDLFFVRVADELDRLAEVERAALEAHDATTPAQSPTIAPIRRAKE